MQEYISNGCFVWYVYWFTSKLFLKDAVCGLELSKPSLWVNLHAEDSSVTEEGKKTTLISQGGERAGIWHSRAIQVLDCSGVNGVAKYKWQHSGSVRSCGGFMPSETPADQNELLNSPVHCGTPTHGNPTHFVCSTAVFQWAAATTHPPKKVVSFQDPKLWSRKLTRTHSLASSMHQLTEVWTSRPMSAVTWKWSISKAVGLLLRRPMFEHLFSSYSWGSRE